MHSVTFYFKTGGGDGSQGYDYGIRVVIATTDLDLAIERTEWTQEHWDEFVSLENMTLALATAHALHSFPHRWHCDGVWKSDEKEWSDYKGYDQYADITISP